MKYLKKFENHAAYEAAQSGLILPNVSLCVNEGDVHYNPPLIIDGHEYVEIGGVKWATMNVGAESVTDIGLYFQWGDTQGYTADQVGSGEGQKNFSWTDYKYSENGTQSYWGTITKYNSTDGKTTLETTDDAVTVAWGGNWRMPTEADFNALSIATTKAWVTNYEGSGVAGLVCTDIADSSKVLFFPACGVAGGGSVNNVDTAFYWSSDVNPQDDYVQVYRLVSITGYPYKINFGIRSNGYNIRGVAD